MISALAVPFFSVANALRGGWVPQWLPAKLRQRVVDASGDDIDAVMHWTALMILADPIVALCSMIGNRLGAGPGWGQYIGTYLNGYYSKGGVRKGEPAPEVAIIDRIIRPLIPRPELYGLAGMALRGVLWSAAVALFLLIAWGLSALAGIDFETRLFLGALGYMFMPVGFLFSKSANVIPSSHKWLAGEFINGAINGTFWWIAS